MHRSICKGMSKRRGIQSRYFKRLWIESRFVSKGIYPSICLSRCVIHSSVSSKDSCFVSIIDSISPYYIVSYEYCFQWWMLFMCSFFLGFFFKICVISTLCRKSNISKDNGWPADSSFNSFASSLQRIYLWNPIGYSYPTPSSVLEWWFCFSFVFSSNHIQTISWILVSHTNRIHQVEWRSLSSPLPSFCTSYTNSYSISYSLFSPSLWRHARLFDWSNIRNHFVSIRWNTEYTILTPCITLKTVICTTKCIEWTTHTLIGINSNHSIIIQNNSIRISLWKSIHESD